MSAGTKDKDASEIEVVDDKVENLEESRNLQEAGEVGVEMSERKSKGILLWEQELAARKGVSGGLSGNVVSAAIVNAYSALLIFAFYLISLESLVSITLSISLTIFAYNTTEDSETFDGSIMNWTMLSFAVITPMSASIGFAFNRREKALEHLSVIKSTLFNIYSAHACWDWCKADKDKSGRVSCDVDWVEHTDKVLDITLKLCMEMTRLLTLPSSSRARHRVTGFGKKEAEKIDSLVHKLHRTVLGRMNTLTDLCEVLKREGLPPNEATRIRQWERFIAERIERLLVIKKYRTPQALRSFARLFTVILPPYYAPFYGQMARDLNSLGMAITFSILTSLALTSLFESISQMEDPFVGIIALDGIDVGKELLEEFQEQLLDCRVHHFPDAKQFEHHGVEAPDLPLGPEIRLFQAAET